MNIRNLIDQGHCMYVCMYLPIYLPIVYQANVKPMTYVPWWLGCSN